MKMTKPTLQTVRFGAQDVIATSGFSCKSTSSITTSTDSNFSQAVNTAHHVYVGNSGLEAIYVHGQDGSFTKLDNLTPFAQGSLYFDSIRAAVDAADSDTRVSGTNEKGFYAYIKDETENGEVFHYFGLCNGPHTN